MFHPLFGKSWIRPCSQRRGPSDFLVWRGDEFEVTPLKAASEN